MFSFIFIGSSMSDTSIFTIQKFSKKSKFLAQVKLSNIFFIQLGLVLVNRMKGKHLQYQQKNMVLISHAKRESIEGIYYLRKAEHSYDGIADIDEIFKSTIQSTIDKTTRLYRLY